jgi:hypothetical protein
MLAGEIETYLREKRYYHKDGYVVWAILTVSLMRKADGSLDYFISVVEDISARKRAEEKLRDKGSPARFRKLPDSAHYRCSVWKQRAQAASGSATTNFARERCQVPYTFGRFSRWR